MLTEIAAGVLVHESECIQSSSLSEKQPMDARQ